MSHLTPLEQDLQDRFILKNRLQAPSGLHRRFLGSWSSKQTARQVLITCASYPELPADSVELQKQLAEKMKAPTSPVLLAVKDFNFDSTFHWMAAEVPSDPDLRSCLREQQRLSVQQVGWLLGRLGEALRCSVEQGWPRLSLDASQILLNLEIPQATLLIPDMPLFGFSTLTITDTLQTMAFNPAAFTSQEAQVPSSTRDYVTPLAALCCEMLGATAAIGSGQNERFRAIPVLTTHQNTLLRTALAGSQRHSFEDLDEFVHQFLDAGEAVSTRHSHSTHTAAGTQPTQSSSGVISRAPGSTALKPISPPPIPQVSPLETLPAGYQLDRELRTIEGWRLCKARHHSGHEALITTLDTSKLLAESQRNLTNILQSLQQAPHKALIKPTEVVGDNRCLHIIRPLPTGRTLLDVLRERRSVSRPTAARLLAAIHAAYEALWAIVPRRLMATSLDQFWLPPENPEGGTQNHNLLLDASQLVVESITDPTTTITHPVNHFARLTLSLLGQGGGALTGPGLERFTPVPELSSEINGVLRRALMPDPSAEQTLPWLMSEVTAALAGHTAVAHASRPILQVPEKLRQLPLKPSDRLRLQSQKAADSVLGLAAGDTFWMGRASTHSDFVAQFRPRSPINDSRTRCISRAQVCALLKNGQIHLKEVGSTNSSLSGSHRLTESEIAQLPLTLVLAGEYPLEIRALKSAYSAPGPAVAEWTNSGTRPMRRGACGFKSLERSILPFESAWVFTDVSLVADASGHLTFDDTMPKNCIARFHHHNGSFWVESSASSRILLNGHALSDGELAPFGHGDELSLHGQIYSVSSFTPEAAA